jgi:hypothetical protein
MKRRRLCLAVAAISVPALAVGLALGGAASAAPSHGSAAAVTSQYSERTVVINCQGRAEVRPGTFTLACADGNDYLTGLSWTSWTPRLASGYGIQEENDCTPYCAAGHFHAYPVLVRLGGSGAVRGNPGSLRYTRITLVYPGARPKAFDGYPGTMTMPLWA